MKCFTGIVFVVLSGVASVLARTKVGTYKSSFTYDLYSDDKATIVGTYYTSMRDAIIPGYVMVNKKQYLVSEIGANAFEGKEINKITIDSSNNGLLIKKNAFYGVKNLRQFNIYSPYVDAEIGGFSGVGTLVQFQGSGIPNTVERYSEKLLKQWDLPVRNNYKYITDDTMKRDLFRLGKEMQNKFGIYDKVAYPDNAANVCFIGSGSSNGLTRLYRIMAIVMGVPSDEVLAACDNMHYCWNYTKVVGFRDDKIKWYVFDIQDKIQNNLYYNPHAFMKESAFIKNNLPKYYGKSVTIDPHKFIVHNTRYNYPNESKYDYKNSENFDDWLERNNAGERTL
ncbi:hypothetical protein PIROE2DRAFT_4651 [Piromyces sp. E2]|nr:hypothetical protein PIROE2DRAFT_4651 [Piromyces sp. E2]|eukprot:OUM67840.1 hypothetical protein PIROE2DRAFT_4651 [Piromyces sp. E2]